MKRVLILIIGILALSGLAYASGTFNPFIGLTGMIKIEMGDESVEIIQETPLTLIAKQSDQFIPYMESLGYTYNEQYGRLYIFEKDGQRVDAQIEQFLSRYWLLSID